MSSNGTDCPSSSGGKPETYFATRLVGTNRKQPAIGQGFTVRSRLSNLFQSQELLHKSIGNAQAFLHPIRPVDTTKPTLTAITFSDTIENGKIIEVSNASYSRLHR